MARYLIIKTSSLGDIIQSFGALSWLQAKDPTAQIDWVVEKRFAKIVEAHPLIARTISFDLKGKKNLWASLRSLRQEGYETIFDLQGNCKSGILTALARGKKVGFRLKSVREWPNVLATHMRFDVSSQTNIRLQYISLLTQYFQDTAEVRHIEGVRFKISSEEKQFVDQLFLVPRIMVCPGSKWINKQLPFETLLAFLKKIHLKRKSAFLLIWGNLEEQILCQKLQEQLGECAQIAGQMNYCVWQNAMAESELVIAMDSAALHLCATTSTPSFSIFGPTSAEIFKPIGPQHLAIQGKCPYSVAFTKQCPYLRSCGSGACLRRLSADEIFQRFQE